MAVLVIGGHTRNIGKTSVVCSILAALPAFHWTAIKITQFGHGVCSANGAPCDCETADHTIAISEERDPASGTDSSRYLAAGAGRSLWVRTRQGQLAEAMPRVRKEIAAAENTIIESNSILRFLQPDLYASVLDPRIEDFKPSSLRYLDRADALLVCGKQSPAVRWSGVSGSVLAGIPIFHLDPPIYYSPAFVSLVEQKFRHATEINSNTRKKSPAPG